MISLPQTPRFYCTLCLLAVLFLLLASGCAQPRPAQVQAAIVPVLPSPTATVAGEARIVAPSPPPPTAVATSTAVAAPPPPPLINAPIPQLAAEAAALGAEFSALAGDTTGYWQYAPGTFFHPVALEILAGQAYLIDGGRVLVMDLGQPAPPRQILGPGDAVQEVLVQEPLDLAPLGGQLLVLDRAGDVYRYDPASGAWTLDRYDRPSAASSGHYFVALDAGGGEDAPVRALLETNYKFVQLYGGGADVLWNLQDLRGVDLRLEGERVYVLQRELHDLAAVLTLYRSTATDSNFRPPKVIEQPRQLEYAPEGLLVLDRAGNRILILHPDSGQLLGVLQPPQDEPVSAIAYDTHQEILLMAGRDRLYFVDRPERLAAVADSAGLKGLQAHDMHLLADLKEFIVPITGSNITFRDFQLPGAPRHYRLGVHNGIDLYWQPGTLVRSVGAGTVIRADTDYEPPTAVELAAWAADTERLGYTSAAILDNYMGRQVWIEHAPGIVSRYAHLRSIAPEISAGTAVDRGQTIGEVGNSGSPASLESEQADAHLHYELWIGETYLGQYLRPIEARELVEQIFPLSR